MHSDTGATFVDIDGEAYDELQWLCADDALAWNVTVLCDTDIILPILQRDSGVADTRISGVYYYHTDHLGSASWITHGDEPVQFIHYMPYGEMWYNQQGSAYNERFKYTGKERDSETGLDYFEARYYASATPMWLSPDPLMDKYPEISPYAYCSWNPLKYVDPDGREEWTLDYMNGQFERISDKGGNCTDYYHIGAYEDGQFMSHFTREINRSSGTINVFRINETDESTISAFHNLCNGKTITILSK